MLEYIIGFASLYFLTYLLITYLEEERHEPEMSKKRTATVLIPAYNEADSIESTVQSALDLEYPSLQIIVIDDGSTDGTGDRAERTGVTVLRQRNSGKAAALNNGIAHAKGELIATLDADSYVAPDALKLMSGYFDDDRVMAVVPAMKVMKGRGALVPLQRAEYLFSNMIANILCLLDSATVTPGPFSVFRASVFKELGGFSGATLTEDNEMALRIQSSNHLIRFCGRAFVYTSVPDSLGALMRQRKRWYIGYLENVRAHWRLLRPRYGELGLFILPITVILMLLAIVKMGLDTGALFNVVARGLAPSAQERFFQPYELLAGFSLLTGMALFYLSVLESREAPSVSIFLHLALMMALSPFLYAYAFIMRAYEIITRRSAKW